MIRNKLRRSPVLPCMAACIALALVACDRSGPPTDVQAPPTDTAQSVVEPSATAPADPAATMSAGPDVLTELGDARRSAQVAESGLCNVDKINGQAITSGSASVVDDPAHLVVTGWVGDKATMTRPPATLRITEVDGARGWEISAGEPRGRIDVARHLGTDGMNDAGFEVAVDASALPPGEYRLAVVHEAGGRTVLCDKGARIRIGG
jgi:hypothetical protein